MPSLSRRKNNDRPDQPKTPATEPGGRSLSSLAKMDIGDLAKAIRLPKPKRRQARPKKPSKRASRAAHVVGVDIEPGFVTAAQVSVNGGIAVERAATAPLAPEIVRDGEVVDVVGLSKALAELFAEHKLDRNVRLGIANQRIVVRMLELPPITDAAELATAVRFQAQEELPMSLDSAVLDFHPLGIHETEAGPRQRVVLVAARREMVERLVAAAREAGLRPQGVDLSAFALIRSLYARDSDAGERVVYLALGGVGNLAVADGTECLFTRVLSVGMESIAADLAERLGVAVGDARHLVMGATLAPEPAAGDEQFPEGGEDMSADPHDIARMILEDGIRRIAVEIRNSLHYHAMHGGDQPVARVVASGVMTEIPGLVAALGKELELDVEVRTVKEAHAGALAGVPAERLAVAAGLAVSEVPT